MTTSEGRTQALEGALWELLASRLGQVVCGVPHTYLFVDGSVCGKCGGVV